MKKCLVLAFILSGNAMAGYSLHIEREARISVSEWLHMCNNDTELVVLHSFSAKNPSTEKTIEISTPNSCLWAKPESDKKHYFVYSDGSISLSYDKDVVEKAKNIANQLNAKLLGDEGEEY